jgi:hypothetical protein
MAQVLLLNMYHRLRRDVQNPIGSGICTCPVPVLNHWQRGAQPNMAQVFLINMYC